jgi:hypothetical protein
MTLPRVSRIHIHLQHVELTCQFAGKQIAGDATVSRIHHPQLSTLKAVLQRRQVQAVAGKHRAGFVALQQLTGTPFDRRQHAELVGARETGLRTS